MDVIEDINKTVLKSNQIYAINRGGCAINAVAIYDYITKNHSDMNPRIMYHSNFGFNEEYIRDRNLDMIGCNHAIVMIDVEGCDFFIDSTGISDCPVFDGEYLCDPEELNEIPRDLCVEHIVTTSWCSWFDRKDTVIIDEIFGTELRDEVLGMSA